MPPTLSFATLLAVSAVSMLVSSISAVAVMSDKDLEAATNVNCSSLMTYAECSPHLHCSWCGSANQTTPDAVCFDRSAGLTCCDVKTLDYYCEFPPQLCTVGETCYHQHQSNAYGDCTVAVCCGSEKPQPCAPVCIAQDAVCCDNGLSCAAGQSCCGGANIGFACCDKDGVCCSSPDGFAHWCCPQGKTCDMNWGCDNP
jgi:hypothetical protein